MMGGMVQDQNMEKQIEKHVGCMAGFFQIFDRHHPLAGKRLHSPRRLPPPPATVIESGVESRSPSMSGELHQPKALKQVPSPGSEIQSPPPEPETPSVKTKPQPLPFPVFEIKEGARSPWKFSKEAPRLSLDSRAATDARGSLYPREIRTANHNGGGKGPSSSPAIGSAGDEDGQRRSPSVIARLMGLENLPSSQSGLQRSASESRVSKDIYRFVDGNNYFCDYSKQGNVMSIAPAATGSFGENVVIESSGVTTKRNPKREPKKSVALQPQRGLGQRKSFYDSTEFFPELHKSTTTVSVHEEVEKKLRVRGIDEPSKDLETLKQILEALQLKGLLHSKDRNGGHGLQNRRKGLQFEESPIVVMRPRNFSGRNQSDLQSPSRSPIRGRIPAQNSRRANSLKARRQPEEWKRASSGDGNIGSEQGRMPLGRSPRVVGGRKAGLDQSTTNRSCRSRKFAEEKVVTVAAAEDEASTVSESSVSTPSQTDTEKSKAEEYKDGRSLLNRCDRLLNSIAEITATTTTVAAELQPSPVSVLDSSFYKEDEGSSSRSPPTTTKRGLNFKDGSAESACEDAWTPVAHSVTTEFDHDDDYRDFTYVSDIVGASNYLPGDLGGLFELLEKRWCLTGKDASRASRIRRKLTFDTVVEILDQRRHSLHWKRALWVESEFEKPDTRQVWSEYRKIRERDFLSAAEDLLESVHGALRKDLTRDTINGWGVVQPIETVESAVNVERLIFKDLIGETIRDLAALTSENSNDRKGSKAAPRRRLAF